MSLQRHLGLDREGSTNELTFYPLEMTTLAAEAATIGQPGAEAA
jgi:hypothetical protein